MRKAVVATLGLLSACVSLDGLSNSPATSSTSADASTEADGPTSNTPDFRSGTRLRARLESVEGGSVFTGWYDVGLGVNCAFRTAQDGMLRCLPLDGTLQATYLEAGCKTPVLAHPKSGCTTPKFAVTPRTECNDRTAFVRVGAQLSATTIYSRDGGGVCRSSDAQAYDVYAIESPVDPQELVGGTIVREPRGQRLSLNIVHGDDGSLQAIDMYDHERNVTCSPYSTTFLRCVAKPLANELQNLYSDAVCTTSTAAAEDDACRAPASVVLMHGPDGCGASDPVLAEAGGKLLQVYRKEGTTTCRALTTSPTFSLRKVGARLPPESFPALTPRYEGEGRIKLQTLTAESGERLLREGLFDSERNTRCFPRALPDGSRRCFPFGAALVTRFSDSACTIPVHAAPPGCVPARWAELVTGDACAINVRLFEVGSTVTPLLVYEVVDLVTGPKCTPRQPSATESLYALTEVPPSALALVQSTRE